jgi:hypothetical protein
VPTLKHKISRASFVFAVILFGAILETKTNDYATSTTLNGVQQSSSHSEAGDALSWPTNILSWTRSPVDLSFLNAAEKPAGKHGFLRAVHDRLIFDDGTQGRFWGTNLTASALFATNDNLAIRRQARRLSELGFNLVRLHHIDSDWVRPNVFGMNKSDTLYLDDTSMDRLDWWIKCLEDEGIYIWLDLHDGRQFRRADKIEDFDEIRNGRPTADLKGFSYVNVSIQNAMQRFNEAYENHLNRYTKLSYKEDPAIVGTLITNENDITHHFGNVLLPDKRIPHEDALYLAEAASFAEAHGLPKDQTWRSWEDGPSKLFLNDLEHKFNLGMVGQLRALGVKSPIATTNTWGNNPLSSLPSLTDGDVIDVHAYGTANVLEANPFYSANFVDWIAAAKVVDHPLTVTEWNVEPFPVDDRQTVPVYLAATADLQGWNALLEYAYAQQSFDRRERIGNWDAFNDPALIGTLPAAALLYRRHDVEEARTAYVFAPTPDKFINESISPDNAMALRLATNMGRLMIALPAIRQLPWLRPSVIPQGAKVFSDAQQVLIGQNANQVISDTGELIRNWEQGTYTINTPRTQAVTGRIGEKEIILADVGIDIVTRDAAVAVQSLDNQPISTASQLMISLAARAVPDPGRNEFYSEPVVGELTIRARNGLKAYRRDGDTYTDANVVMSYADGHYRIKLTPDLRTYWLIMK